MIKLNQLTHNSIARSVTLDATAKNRDNVNTATYVNDIYAEMEDGAPKGVLAGMVATLGANGTYTIADEADATVPMGLFGLNADGEPFENNVPRKTGRITLVAGKHNQLTVNVYETRAAASMGGAADNLVASYTTGTLLYSSAQGLLTTEDAAAQTPVAIVEKAPSVTNREMTIVLL